MSKESLSSLMQQGAAPVPADDPRSEAVRNDLRELLGAERFDRWFSAFSVVEDDGATVTLGLPNLFIQDWIQQRYRGELERAIAARFGARALRLRVDGELYRRFRREESAFLEAASSALGAAEKSAAAEPVAAPAGQETTPPASPLLAAASARGPAESTGRATRDLNERLTLDTFVVGVCNHVAFRAGIEVVRGPQAAYNPLFIYAESGLGKTHLIQGLTRAYVRNGIREVRYMSCEEFTNRFIDALKSQGLERFRERFRPLKALILDDVHVLENKVRTQTELLHTLDELASRGSQVILAGNKRPQAIENLQKPLRNRLASGLVCRLAPPDYPTRLAILEQEARRANAQLPEAVLHRIAERFHHNVRELIGAGVRVAAYASLISEPLTEARAEEILDDQLRSGKQGINLELIVKVVAERHRLEPGCLCSRTRVRTVSHARQVAMYLARALTEHSLVEIGQFFGGRDHATVNFSFRKVLNRVLRDKDFKRAIEETTLILQGR